MKAPPSPNDRPTLEGSRRKDWRAFFLQEWGLLLLAAALALIIWHITSRRVIKPRPLQGVEVVLEVDASIRDRVGAVFAGAVDGTVTRNFELVCSEREYNEAIEALDRNGRRQLVLRVTKPPDNLSRAINDTDSYLWPFASHERILADGTAERPPGTVFDLAPAHPRVDWLEEDKATLPSRSELDDERGIQVSITFSRESMNILAPKGREGETAYTVITPDPINLASVAGGLVSDSDVPFDTDLVYDLTFDDWRNRGDDVEKAWRKQIQLPPIQATVRLTQISQRTLKNRVILQLPDEFEVEMDRQGLPGLSPPGSKLTFTGTLRGPSGVLDALERDLDGWAWGIDITDPAALPDGTMGGGPSEWLKFGARFFWYPTKDEYRDHGVRFKPERGQDVFDIKVRWSPRKP